MHGLWGRTWQSRELHSDRGPCLVRRRAPTAERVWVSWVTPAVGDRKKSCLWRKVNCQISFGGPLNLQYLWFLQGHAKTMLVTLKFTVPKGHESGRGESLLDAFSADKPVNCADYQSEGWKERRKRGNLASNLIHLFHRKAHKVTHRPSIQVSWRGGLRWVFWRILPMLQTRMHQAAHIPFTSGLLLSIKYSPHWCESSFKPLWKISS